MLVSYCPASPLSRAAFPGCCEPDCTRIAALQQRTRPRVRLHSDHIDRASNNHAPGTPPPRSKTDHVLRHGNADVCSSAGLLPARTTTNTNSKTAANPEAPAPTTVESIKTRRPPGPAESAKALLLPAPCFTYRRSINEARLAPDEETRGGRAPLVPTKTIN